MVEILLITSYILSVLFARQAVARWHKSANIDVGGIDLLIVFVPVVNVIIGSLLLIEEYGIVNKFFGINKRKNKE